MIVRQSLSKQVYDLIRERLASLEILPGQRLDISGLSAELGISRIPIREALKALGERGLVTWIPDTGYEALRMGREMVRDLFAMRRLLEGEALRTFSMDAGRSAVHELLSQSELLLEQDLKGASLRDAFDSLDAALHEGLIVSGCKNALLRQSHLRLNDLAAIVVHLNDRIDESLREHVEVLRALEASDLEAAHRALMSHLLHAEEACFPVPRDTEEWEARRMSIYGMRQESPHVA